MPSPALLDFDALTTPISADAPAGVPLPYDVRLKLEEFRKEVNPEDYDADDPRRPAEARKPDWKGIVKLATETLEHKSKDLLVAARLTEALTIDKGFNGLRDSVDLLGRLIDQCWDRIYPAIENGETPEAREGPFKWLNETGYGAQFPLTVRLTPLLSVNGKGYNLTDWQNQARRGEFESAVAQAPAEVCQNLADDLKATREKLQFLSKALHEKMGDLAPDLVSSENTENIGAAVNDCLKVANQILQLKTGTGSREETMTGNDSAAGRDGAAVSRSLASRAEAYRLLNEAADMLQRLEPHSPIPYLVKRAVKLGELRFPELMRALIRENAVLDELDRLMGITPPPTG